MIIEAEKSEGTFLSDPVIYGEDWFRFFIHILFSLLAGANKDMININ